MGWEHEPDTVWRAQELYCEERLSYARVAELTGVSATTLKAWGQKFQWARRREQLAQAESEIRFNTIMGRKAILERLLEAGDGKEAAQAAFAVASLENLALKRAELAASGKIPSYAEPEARPVISTRADAVAALKQAVEGKLGMALADPSKISVRPCRTSSAVLICWANLRPDCPGMMPASRSAGEAFPATWRSISARLLA